MFMRCITKTKCLLCAAVLLAILGMQAGFAEAPGRGIDAFVLLVHPCPYEALGKAETDPYRVLERAACQRWFDAIPSLPRSAFVVEVDFAAKGPSPDKLHQAFIDRLGAERVCRIPCESVSPEDAAALQAYYDRIIARITNQIAAQSLTFDAATRKAVIWGQSFEGCAPGYGSAIAHGLGLKTPTDFSYAMSAPDAPFVLNASFMENVPVPDSDIEAYVFDLNDGRCAAFFRSRLTPQWLDHRPITLTLDEKLFTVLTKQGELVWPKGEPPTAEQLQHSRYNQWRKVVWPEGTPPDGPTSFTLATVQERYVATEQANRTELIAVIGTAKVIPEAR